MSFWKSVKFVFNGRGLEVLNIKLVKFGCNPDIVLFIYKRR